MEKAVKKAWISIRSLPKEPDTLLTLSQETKIGTKRTVFQVLNNGDVLILPSITLREAKEAMEMLGMTAVKLQEALIKADKETEKLQAELDALKPQKETEDKQEETK